MRYGHPPATGCGWRGRYDVRMARELLGLTSMADLYHRATFARKRRIAKKLSRRHWLGEADAQIARMMPAILASPLVLRALWLPRVLRFRRALRRMPTARLPLVAPYAGTMAMLRGSAPMRVPRR